MRQALLPTFASALVLASCIPAARPPAPPPAPRAPAPIVALPPPVPADWRDWPMTPGTWAYRRDARGSIALFGMIGGDARLTLRCEAGERRLFLSRTGSATGPLAIRTSTTARTLAVQPTGGAPAYVAAVLGASDPLLDAMAFSRGRFTVEQAGAPALVVPAWPEIGRVVEDCRH